MPIVPKDQTTTHPWRTYPSVTRWAKQTGNLPHNIEEDDDFKQREEAREAELLEYDMKFQSEASER